MTVKMKRLFQYCVLLIMYQPAAAQFEHHVIGARPASFGGSGVLLYSDPWGAFVNPALYATISNVSASAAYIPGRFGLSELQSSAATIIYPLSIGTAAASVHRFGFELYSEATVSVSGARAVTDRLTVGGTLNWYHLSIERYGSAATAGITAGIGAVITKNLSTGFVVSNINRPSIGQNDNSLPQVIRAGVLYRPFPPVTITAEIEKDILFEPEFRFGVEYLLSELFYVRAGMNDRPARAAGGFSLRHRSIQFDYALQWHLELGQTHYITVSFTLPKARSRRGPPSPGIAGSIDSRPDFSFEQLVLPSEVFSRLADPVIESLLRFINNAGESRLVELPGVGPVMAERIILYRQDHGQFKSLQELQNVRGIGERTIETILDYWRLQIRSGEPQY